MAFLNNLPELNLTTQDLKILQVLADDARISNAALAARCNMPASSALSRVNRLRQNGTIRGFHTAIDRKKLGKKLDVMVSVALNTQAVAAVDEVLKLVQQLSHVYEIMKVTGAFHFIVYVSVADTEELESEVLSRLGMIEGVLRTETSLVLEHYRRPSLLGELRPW